MDKNDVDTSRSYNERNFYSPKKRVGKIHVKHNAFMQTVSRVFKQGGNYTDVARELMISPSAVYTRVRKLKEQGDTSLPAISGRSSDMASDAVKILGQLGVSVDYTPTETATLEAVNSKSAAEANEILKELGLI